MIMKSIRLTALCTISMMAFASFAEAQSRAPRPGIEPQPMPAHSDDAGAGGSYTDPYADAQPDFDSYYQDRYITFDDGSAQSAREQAQGNYPELSRMAGGMPLGQIQDAWSDAAHAMPDGQFSPGVVHFNWSPDVVMPIRIRDNMITKLILPDWEEAVEVIAGEDYYLQSIKYHNNIIGIRSGASGIDTTVDIVGSSGNVYSFYVRAESHNTGKITDISVFVKAPPSAARAMTGRGMIAPNYSAWGQARPWGQPSGQGGVPQHGYQQAQGVYPMPGPQFANGRNVIPAQNPHNAPMQAYQNGAGQYGGPYQGGHHYQGGNSGGVGAKLDFISVSAPIPEQMNFNMQMFEVSPGDRDIAPELVYTDAGGWTYFDFGSKGHLIDRPVVLKVVDGVEQRVNTRTIGVNGEILVAETTGEFILRSGGRAICVVPAT